MAAMILTFPEHFEQTVTSMLKTRFSKRAQVMRFADGGLSESASEFDVATPATISSGFFFGTICFLCL